MAHPAIAAPSVIYWCHVTHNALSIYNIATRTPDPTVGMPLKDAMQRLLAPKPASLSELIPIYPGKTGEEGVEEGGDWQSNTKVFTFLSGKGKIRN